MATSHNNQSLLSEAMQFRMLLERVLTPRMGRKHDREELAEIVPGALPAILPFDLPLPTPHRMIGSLVMSMEAKNRTAFDARIHLDTPLSADTIFAFYTEHLLDWSEQVPLAYRTNIGGFQMIPEIDGASRLYVHPQFGALTVMVNEGADQQSDVVLFWEDRLPQPPRNDTYYQPTPANIFPRLYPPAHAHTNRASSDIAPYDHSAFGKIEVEIPMELATVLAHYGEQLRTAGWLYQQESLSPPLAWSLWRYSTEDGKSWRGMLIVVAGENPQRISVYFNSEWFNAQKQD